MNPESIAPSVWARDGRFPLDEVAALFDEHGLVVLRGLVPEARRAPLRAAAAAGLDAARARGAVMNRPDWPDVDFPLGDLLAMRELEPWDYLFFSDEVQRVVRRLLGVDSPVYWGDSQFHVGSGMRGFHKDNAGRIDGSHDDWRDARYGLLRCGLYMQDHDRLSGGLKVRLGSHRHPDHRSGRIVDVDSRFGDLVIWNLRLTHSGNARRSRLRPSSPLHPRIEKVLPRWAVLPEPARRIAAFCTFGAPGTHLERYMDYLERCSDEYRPYFLHARHPDEAEPLLRRAGLTFRRPTSDYGARDPR
ncbi:MAG: hypothetical protein RJA99_3455 [Pseudomonadota bacterium]